MRQKLFNISANERTKKKYSINLELNDFCQK